MFGLLEMRRGKWGEECRRLISEKLRGGGGGDQHRKKELLQMGPKYNCSLQVNVNRMRRWC